MALIGGCIFNVYALFEWCEVVLVKCVKLLDFSGKERGVGLRVEPVMTGSGDEKLD